MKDEENHLGVLMEKEPLMGASDKGGASEAPPAPLENKTGKKMVFAAALALCVFAVDALKTAAPMTHVAPMLATDDYDAGTIVVLLTREYANEECKPQPNE